MMKNQKISYIEYEMENGECITMSTAPILLLKLRGTNKKAYENMSKMLVKGGDEKDVMCAYEFLYNAYICANQEESERMTFMEFIENANQNFSYNADMMREMISPSKKQDSEQPSEEQ